MVVEDVLNVVDVPENISGIENVELSQDTINEIDLNSTDQEASTIDESVFLES
ncbi:hypothetical protein J6T66_02520 [bacterium]|nr:hypothetical protein [bacterium]